MIKRSRKAAKAYETSWFEDMCNKWSK